MNGEERGKVKQEIEDLLPSYGKGKDQVIKYIVNALFTDEQIVKLRDYVKVAFPGRG